MSNASDFVIENNILTKYIGLGGDVSIPDGVTGIDDSAFSNCRSLTSVTIPDSVISIGSRAFNECRSLTSVTIPNSVTSIGKDAFKSVWFGNDKLDSVYISDLTAWCKLGFDGYYANPLCRAHRLFLNGELVTNLIIPDSVTSIGGYAFQGCRSLTSVTIPDSVTSIGDSAFSSCSSLTSVTIPDSVTSIGNSTFSRCSSLTSATIPDSVTSIGGYAFQGCSSLTSVTIPDSVTSIGGGAFEYCNGLHFVYISDLAAWCKIGFDGYSSNPLYQAHRLFLNGELVTNLVIPDSVTRIGNYAFSDCSSLTSVSIPDSVTSIGEDAFCDCSGLTSVTIPDSVTSIGDGAFRRCSSLTSVTIPDSVIGIGEDAFCGCSSLTSLTIPDSVTSIGNFAFSHCSSLTSITIPDSVTSIGRGAFFDCSSLTSVTIPDSVTNIGDSAFSECSSLTSVTIPDSVNGIGDSAFSGCVFQIVSSPRPLTSRTADNRSFGLVLPGEKNQYRAYSARTDLDNLSEFVIKGNWLAYDLELINNGPKFKYSLPARLLGALGRLLDPAKLKEENRALFTELLNKNAKKLVPLAEMLGSGVMIRDLFSLGILDDKTLKGLKKALAASAVPEVAALADAETAAVVKASPAKAEPQSPLAKAYAEKIKAVNGDDVIRKMKLIGSALPKLQMADGSDAPEELFRFVLASYGMQDTGEYHIDPEADKTAALLAYDSLCAALDAVSNHLDAPSYPALLPLLCRYGNAAQIRSMINACKSWDDWDKYGQKGRRAQELFKAALMLSDTHEAVVWLEKNSDLKGYARLRGISEAEVYEQYLFDFGFDAEGKKVYDLGSTTVEASIDSELKISLYDTVSKKKLRGIPRKGIDPAVQKKAADDLADLRANLKKAVRIKIDQLFYDYLSGKAVAAEAWQKSYLNNPLLQAVAMLLVWEQNGNCFTLGAAGPIDSAGQGYAITDAAIRIAHPMEMKQEEIAAWQRYFNAHGLKQPFAQVWEPVYKQGEIREDRYEGCPIHSYYLKNQERRGIHIDWWEREYGSSSVFEIKGFDVEADGEYDDSGNLTLEILTLRPKTWNRRANMVIAFLDRITVWGRVKKDDVSVMLYMDRFTLAQITELIHIAQEADAVNVLALLLEYKNEHFADFDPMEEFTLEW